MALLMSEMDHFHALKRSGGQKRCKNGSVCLTLEAPKILKTQGWKQYFSRCCPTQMVNALAALAVILLSLKYHIGFTVVNFLTLI